jgi:hypothetical protein
VTGYLKNDLKDAITQCLKLDRYTVEKGSERWCWEVAWQIFKDNLINV